MSHELTAYPMPSRFMCEICGCVIHHPDTLLIADPDYPVCRAFECRNLLRQKSSMTPAVFKSHIEFKRQVNAQRLAREARDRQRMDEITARECREHSLIQQSVLNNHPDLCEHNTHLLVIPTGMTRTTPLSPERIADYTRHLHTIIGQAAEHASVSEVVQDQHHVAHEKLIKLEQQFAENPALQSVSDQLCRLCRGGCCAAGKEHAYLSVITLRRYMDSHPDMSRQALADMYLSHLHSETVEEACINQTADGCALPRALRSDICNEYYCDAIRRLHRQQVNTAPMPTVLAIQRSANHWNQFNPQVCNDVSRVALLDGEKMQVVMQYEPTGPL